MATFYVSNAGNDSNNGTSISTPWQSVARVNSASLNPGDKVLFRRGDIFRVQLTNASAGTINAPITYADYGEGPKPGFRGSNVFGAASWTNKSGNLWYVSGVAADPGLVVRDGILGKRKTSEGALLAQWDYWYDSGNTRMEVYSVGNPGTLATVIEIPMRDNFWNQFGSNYVNFLNLDIRHFNSTVHLTFATININWTNIDFGATAKNVIQYNNGGSGVITNCTFTDWGVIDGQQYAVQVIGFSGGVSGPIDAINNKFVINHNSNATELACVIGDDHGWVRTCTGNVGINNGTFPGSMFWTWRPGSNATFINFSNNVAIRPGNHGVYIQELENFGAAPTVLMNNNYVEDAGQSNSSDTAAMRVYGPGITAASTVSVIGNSINRTKQGANSIPGMYLNAAIGITVKGNTIQGCDDGILVKNAATGNKITGNIVARNRGFGINVQDTSTATTFNTNTWLTNSKGNFSGISIGAGDVTSIPTRPNATNVALSTTNNDSSGKIVTNFSQHPVQLSSDNGLYDLYTGALVAAESTNAKDPK